MSFTTSKSLLDSISKEKTITPYSLYCDDKRNISLFELELPYDGYKSDDIVERLTSSVISYAECGNSLHIALYPMEFTNSIKDKDSKYWKLRYGGPKKNAIPLSRILGRFDEPIVLSKFDLFGDVVERVTYSQPTLKINECVGNYGMDISKNSVLYEDGIPSEFYIVADFKEKTVETFGE